MVSISFSSLHFTINGSEPSISQLKILFSKEFDFPLRYSNIEYLFNSCRIDENLYWIYARHGKQYPYSSSVLNTETKSLARHPTSCNSGTPVALINSLTERLGNALVRPASASTSHKSRYVKATSNGLTAIRNAILASLACS